MASLNPSLIITGRALTVSEPPRPPITRTMKTIIAIDPGPTESAILHWNGLCIAMPNILPNDQVMAWLNSERSADDVLAIEMVASYGMAVGKEVFETVLWVGRFDDRWTVRTGNKARLVYRRDVKLHHCYSARATDSNVRTALVDRFGAPGKKASPGITYGLKSHLWSAFAVATYIWDTDNKGQVSVPAPLHRMTTD